MQHETGVDGATLECLQLHVARGFGEFDGDARVPLAKAAQPARQRAEPDGGDEPQSHPSRFSGHRTAGSPLQGFGLCQ